MMGTHRALFPHRRFLVSPESLNPSPDLAFDAESSQRTQLFPFPDTGRALCRRVGHQSIVVIAENGQMAVHLPATEGRIGPFLPVRRTLKYFS